MTTQIIDLFAQRLLCVHQEPANVPLNMDEFYDRNRSTLPPDLPDLTNGAIVVMNIIIYLPVIRHVPWGERFAAILWSNDSSTEMGITGLPTISYSVLWGKEAHEMLAVASSDELT